MVLFSVRNIFYDQFIVWDCGTAECRQVDFV